MVKKTKKTAGKTTRSGPRGAATVNRPAVGFEASGASFKSAKSNRVSTSGKAAGRKRSYTLSKSAGDIVTLPRQDYEELVEAAEMRKARRAYEATRDEEVFPAEVVNAIIDGANPVRTWRKYRGLKQAELAEGLGISKSHLSEVETGKGNLSVPVLSALADALEVDMEMLVPREA